MTPEAPQRIDLADVSSWDQIDDWLLTPEDKALLSEQFKEDQESIMYLTRQELTELAQIIEKSTNWENDAQSRVIHNEEKIQNFLSEQIAEWLSLSDILGEENEGIQIVESIAADILFWEWAVLSGLNLSDRPQRYLTTSLSLSLIDYIHASENPVELLENPEEFLVEINDRLESLKTLANSTVWHRGIDMQARLNIEADWEQNTICMNVLEGKNFFDTLFTWDLDAAWIESTLEEANSENPIEQADLWEVSREAISQVQDILSRIPETGDNGGTSNWDNRQELANIITRTVNWAETAEEKKSIMELLLDLIKGILNLANNMFDGTASSLTEATQNNRESWSDMQTGLESISNELLSKITDLKSEQLGNLDTEAITTRLNDSATQLQLRLTLQSLIPESNLEQTIEHLFSWEDGKNTVFGQFTTTLRENWFPSLWVETTQTPIEQFLAVLEEYRQYRTSPWVQSASEDRTTWVQYAQERARWEWGDN